MLQRLLKPLRVVLALIFFLATAALFLDLEGRVPAAAFDTTLYLQLTPSAVRLVEAIGWGAAGAAVVLLITLLFGRVFCSAICPLGTLQDAVIRLAGRLRRSKKRVRFRYRRPRHLLAYGLLTASVAAALAGSLLLVAQLDPFSHFGRIMGLVLRPLTVMINNLLAWTLEGFGSYLVAPVEFTLAHWQALLVPLFVLALLVWMATRHGRLFCNGLCPVGTLLGLVSRFALLRIRIDRERCSLCAQCSLQCKAECIHLKDKRVDFDRCVACFNCIPACPESGIGYRLVWPRPRRPEIALSPVDADVDRAEERSPTGRSNQVWFRDSQAGVQSDLISADAGGGRRAFLLGGVACGLGLAGLSVLSRAEDWPRNKLPTEIPVLKEHPVAPPGAGSRARFNATCTACQLCVSVCPTQVLQPSLLAYGVSGFLQPRMAYEVAYCTYECIRCTEVCPTDAIRLLDVESKKRAKIGQVHFIEDNCIVVSEKTACGACAEHCPTKAVHMVDYETELTIPELDTAICIGCGACEYACPVRPHRAIYVDGEPIQQVADAPPDEALEVEIPDEFPF